MDGVFFALGFEVKVKEQTIDFTMVNPTDFKGFFAELLCVPADDKLHFCALSMSLDKIIRRVCNVLTFNQELHNVLKIIEKYHVFRVAAILQKLEMVFLLKN